MKALTSAQHHHLISRQLQLHQSSKRASHPPHPHFLKKLFLLYSMLSQKSWETMVACSYTPRAQIRGHRKGFSLPFPCSALSFQHRRLNFSRSLSTGLPLFVNQDWDTMTLIHAHSKQADKGQRLVYSLILVLLQTVCRKMVLKISYVSF